MRSRPCLLALAACLLGTSSYAQSFFYRQVQSQPHVEATPEAMANSVAARITVSVPAIVVAGSGASGAVSVAQGSGFSYDLANNPPWLSVNATDGTLTARPTPGATSATGVVVLATKSGNTYRSAPFDIAVAQPTASVSPSDVTVVEGDALSVAMTSNIPGAVYAIQSSTPSLPAWLTMSSAGTISLRTGDVAASADYAVTLMASDGTTTKTVPLTLRMKAVTATVGSAKARSGAAFSVPLGLSAPMGGDAAWVVTGPSGVRVDNGTALAGTAPANGGSAPVDVALTAYRLAGTAPQNGTAARSSTGTGTLSVYPPLSLSGIPGAVSLKQGTTYTGTLTAANAMAAPTWKLTGTLPPGLSPTASGNTYVISGTPTDASSPTVTVTATDSTDGSAQSTTIAFAGSSSSTPIRNPDKIYTQGTGTGGRFISDFSQAIAAVTDSDASTFYRITPNQNSTEQPMFDFEYNTAVVASKIKIKATCSKGNISTAFDLGYKDIGVSNIDSVYEFGFSKSIKSLGFACTEAGVFTIYTFIPMN